MPTAHSHKELLEKYPLDQLENWFAKIEKNGYSVSADIHQCQIYDEMSKLFIDADFFDDYHLNAAMAIHEFFYGD